MTEYGLFSDEGMVDGPFYSLEEAASAHYERYTEEDALHVYEVCAYHPEQRVLITEEEALVLQGMPRHWEIAGTEGQRRLQIGNACPPQMTALLVQANRPKMMEVAA